MDELDNLSVDQLQQLSQAKDSETVQKAATAPLPSRDKSLDDMSIEELQTASLGHQIRHEQQLAPFREAQKRGEGPSGIGEGVGSYLGRMAVAPLRAPLTNALYGLAKSRIADESASDGDRYVVAQYEHEHGLDQQQPEWAKWAGVAAQAPGAVATFGLAPGTALAAHAIGGTAAAEGVAPWDVAALAKSGVTTAAQLAVLKAMGPLAGKLFPAAEGAVAKIGTQALTGTAGLAVADYATHITGLTQGGGPIQDAIEGKFGDAARGTVSNLLLTGGLAAAESVHRGVPPKKAVAQAVEAARAQAEQAVQPLITPNERPLTPNEPPKTVAGPPEAPGAAPPAEAQTPTGGPEVAAQGTPEPQPAAQTAPEPPPEPLHPLVDAIRDKELRGFAKQFGIDVGEGKQPAAALRQKISEALRQGPQESPEANAINESVKKEVQDATESAGSTLSEAERDAVVQGAHRAVFGDQGEAAERKTGESPSLRRAPGEPVPGGPPTTEAAQQDAGPPAPAHAGGEASPGGGEAAGDKLSLRINELMKQGYSAKAANEKAMRELAPRQEKAMGAAALGELTGEANTPEDARLTALAHAKSDEIRQAHDLAERAKGAGYPDEAVFAAATAAVQADPSYPERLVDKLTAKTRPTDPIETAVLLGHTTRLEKNLDQLKMIHGDSEDGKADIAAAKAEVKRARDATDAAGSSSGAAFRLRKALMDQDYSVVGMLKRMEKAKGRELTKEEEADVRAHAQKIAELEKSLQESVAEVDKLKAAKQALGDMPESDPIAKGIADKLKDLEGTTLKGREGVLRGRRTFDDKLTSAEDANKPWWAKAQDKALQLQRFNILSGVTTLGKLAAAGGTRMVLAPIRQAVAQGWSWMPYVSQIAERSARWGRFSPAAEIEAITKGLPRGLKSAAERSPFGSGQSQTDVLYGKNQYPRGEGAVNRVLNAPGETHGAEKAIPFENEFARSLAMRTDFYRKQGKPVETDAMKHQIGVEAYHDAEEATFMRGPGDYVSKKINALVNDLHSADKDGRYSFLPYTAGTALKSTVPVLKVPMNIVGEAMRGIFGTITGSAAVGDAFAKGISNLSPDRADLIMKRLTDGTVGGVFLALGAVGVVKMGGLYVPGDRKKELKGLGAGEAEIDGITIPKEALHDPRLLLMQAGATAADQANKIAKRGHGPQGIVEGSAAALGAILHDTPIVRQMEQTGKAVDPKTRDAAMAEMIKSFAVPQLVQWLARQADKTAQGQVQKRKPEGVIQGVETGIPGLRQTVPQR